MKRKEISVWTYADTILSELSKGVLLTTQADNKVNSMTISWGSLGIEWGCPIFTTFVREGRFTREQLEKNGQFTVNIPYGTFQKKILGFCGSRSGRDTDKIKEMGLTLVPGETIPVPAIKELPLTLECEVIYHQLQNLDAIRNRQLVAQCYPQDVPSNFTGSNKDAHIAFCGRILKAYILEE